MKKTAIALLTALTMLVLFSACGKTEPNEKTESKNDSNVSVTSSTSSSESLNINTDTEVSTVEVTEPTEIDVTDKFTNKTFLDSVREAANKTGDEPIFMSDIPKIKKIAYSDKEITNLDGLEYLTELTDLGLYADKKDLDFYMSTEIETKTFDLSCNTKLETLRVTNVPVTTLDLSHNIALTDLNLDNTRLTTLDLSHNTELINLMCVGFDRAGNENTVRLASININKCTKLTNVTIRKNRLIQSEIRTLLVM